MTIFTTAARPRAGRGPMTIRARCRLAIWIWIVFVLVLAGAVMTQAQDWRTEDHGRRLAELERVRGDTRISVLEDRLGRLENLIYGIGILMGGNLIATGISVRYASKREP